MVPCSTTKVPFVKASPSASSGFSRILISVAVVRKRTATGVPEPSPQENLAPLAVVNEIEPWRIKPLRKRRNNRSIEPTATRYRGRRGFSAPSSDARGTDWFQAHIALFAGVEAVR